MDRLRRVGWTMIISTVVALMAATAASATTTETYMTFSDTTTNPCNGDLVAITGTMHFVAISNDNKAEIQMNWPDTEGVAVDGTRYQANDTTHTYTFSTGPNAFVFTVHDSYELISQDNTSNFLMHEDVKINLLDPSQTTIHGAGAECSGPTPAPPPPV